MIAPTIYHLPSCSTCQRIIQAWRIDQANLRDIKAQPLTEAEVDAMASLAGSYEAIFSKRSRKYRALGLHLQTLTEADYRHWLLQDYTFLARPVLMTEDRIFVGNAQKTVEEATFFLHRR